MQRVVVVGGGDLPVGQDWAVVTIGEGRQHVFIKESATVVAVLEAMAAAGPSGARWRAGAA